MMPSSKSKVYTWNRGEREEGKKVRKKGEKKLTTSGNLLTSSSHTDHDALTPTLVTGLEGRTHHTHVTSAVKGVVTATIRHLNQVLLDRLALQLGGVDKVRGTKLAGPRLLAIVDIDRDDHASLVPHGTLHNGQTDTADTKDGNVGTLLDLGGLHGGSVPGGDTATQQTGAVGGDLGSHRHDGDVGHDGVLREGRGSHEVEDILTPGLETGGAIGHHTLTLSGTDLTAQVGLARLAELALTALGGAMRWTMVSSCRDRMTRTCTASPNTRGVHSRYKSTTPSRIGDSLKSNHIVAGLDRGHTLTHGLDNTGTLVAQDNGESTLGILSRQSVGVYIANQGVSQSRSFLFLPLSPRLRNRARWTRSNRVECGTYRCGRHQCGESECGPRAPWEERPRHPPQTEAHPQPRRWQPLREQEVSDLQRIFYESYTSRCCVFGKGG